ncbi:CocE/NonD family hydrolase [Steroidobacter sp. S1-65]|uniref:CocE/NonD family hydrolase n=2 Tax=Steroidobacter gossypii TaxID=2805490 RepID=A0ABS1WRT4_9GAMM|nr:CocE/NonD family hydrolase [Steroidobacter gossypii]MBM0103658.1 CocE/NonD family hydrolase [Steroidobacter gossypii]
MAQQKFCHMVGVLLLGLSLQAGAAQAVKSLPSETPEKFTPSVDSYDFVKREVMIPMRDGVKLKTFILVPRSATRDAKAPIIMTRTPYNAAGRVSRFNSPRLAAVVPQMHDTNVEAGYIVVYQDVRGKFGSEGDYVLTRPLRGPLNPTKVDHATDAYDTIEWLVKNVPESNGRVGTIGGSYEGYTTVMSTVNPHPALKVAVPFAPMIDGWMGDDWFHNGAFRQGAALEFIYGQQSTRSGSFKWWWDSYDIYDTFLRAGSAGALAKTRGLEQLGFWRAISEHTSYDSWWQEQAVDKLLARQPLKVPMMIVGGLFDQEDIYGSPALYKALAPKDPNGELVHLVMGPWNHGQGRREGRSLGALEFNGDTAGWFRNKIMQPFLDHHLKDAPKPNTPRVLVYETGANEWHEYDHWPRSCANGCAQKSRPLYLLSGGRLGFEAPQAGESGYDEYISDPAKPVPYRQRPILPMSAANSGWGEWLVDDQRHAASRTDVLVYQTEPLTEAVRLAGQPIAQLFASTSGTDSDWVVKIIDVWPDEVPDRPSMGGYQLMLSADIFRGRYRADLSKPQPLTSNEALPYSIALPQVNHTFLPGHRIMVQIQSSWFPLYDRNPQSFVPNIMFAEPASYVKATQRIWRTPEQASSIELPVVAAQ